MLFCVWNLLVAVCSLFLSLSWNFCQFRGNNKNGMTMWGFGLEEILLASIVNHTRDSAIMLSRIYQRVFINVGLKFTSDRENILVEKCIFKCLVIYSPCGRVAKVGKKWSNKSSENICYNVPHYGPLVWLFIEPNYYSYVRLVHYTISVQCRLHLWGQGEIFLLSLFPVEFTPSIFFWYLNFLWDSLFLWFSSSRSSCLYAILFMYIPSNFPCILWLGHQYQSWPYLVIWSFHLFTLQD